MLPSLLASTPNTALSDNFFVALLSFLAFCWVLPIYPAVFWLLVASQGAVLERTALSWSGTAMWLWWWCLGVLSFFPSNCTQHDTLCGGQRGDFNCVETLTC